MSYTGRAITKALYAPHLLTAAERAFIGDLDEFRAAMGIHPGGGAGYLAAVEHAVLGALDPELIPGHQYATESEARDHLETTTVPAVAMQNRPEQLP